LTGVLDSSSYFGPFRNSCFGTSWLKTISNLINCYSQEVDFIVKAIIMQHGRPVSKEENPDRPLSDQGKKETEAK
jgi:hypothetical protein